MEVDLHNTYNMILMKMIILTMMMMIMMIMMIMVMTMTMIGAGHLPQAPDLQAVCD